MKKIIVKNIDVTILKFNEEEKDTIESLLPKVLKVLDFFLDEEQTPEISLEALEASKDILRNACKEGKLLILPKSKEKPSCSIQ